MRLGSESKARLSLRFISIDTKDEDMHSMSMLTELLTLTIWILAGSGGDDLVCRFALTCLVGLPSNTYIAHFNHGVSVKHRYIDVIWLAMCHDNVSETHLCEIEVDLTVTPVQPNINPRYEVVRPPAFLCGIPLTLPTCDALLSFFYPEFFSAQCGCRLSMMTIIAVYSALDLRRSASVVRDYLTADALVQTCSTFLKVESGIKLHPRYRI
ncbi:hypothetical protein EVAR_72342_1 [Eumeta japonica]|uniref:Uncharacterized protein n=1 Tax=Eumeta variegata TaxID=151549 RepID=A0A4C1SXJ1_EUMVA|nr:hypothetical protein EVAR_72342_1 [Eumeta japonica]